MMEHIWPITFEFVIHPMSQQTKGQLSVAVVLLIAVAVTVFPLEPKK